MTLECPQCKWVGDENQTFSTLVEGFWCPSCGKHLTTENEYTVAAPKIRQKLSTEASGRTDVEIKHNWLYRLLKLEKDWDSYGAEPPEPVTLLRAMRFLDNINVIPTNDGGVQFEWYANGFVILVEFMPKQSENPPGTGGIGVYVCAPDGSTFEGSDEYHEGCECHDEYGTLIELADEREDEENAT